MSKSIFTTSASPCLLGLAVLQNLPANNSLLIRERHGEDTAELEAVNIHKAASTLAPHTTHATCGESRAALHSFPLFQMSKLRTGD
ncbi:hypothetical protein E2C01_073334 [Portunus trituberculatus]|uniref:Uncharacterized protein n=1 Tax=Portunus trituberculatus TaxID=210409 RepID=A0A5B7IAB0_PORTR|nr:hypothetical protein [Portunus trituberculatus]